MTVSQSPIPTFYLYGEPHRTVDERFVHVESLDDRNRPSGWTIRPHAHADLSQIFHVAHGGGVLSADDRSLPYEAPCLLLIPRGIVHGFAWREDSGGAVMTLSTDYLAELRVRHAELEPLFDAAAVLNLDTTADEEAGDAMARLMRELGWDRPGHRIAVEAELLALLVLVLRLRGRPDARTSEVGRQAALVAMLRQRIEARYRLREPVSVHADALGVTAAQLRTACARVARQSPSAMLDQRTLIEAKRALLYSYGSVADIGYALGFPDPTYFSRFFSRLAGCSPRAFRDSRPG